jgi:hypothetical protein
VAPDHRRPLLAKATVAELRAIVLEAGDLTAQTRKAVAALAHQLASLSTDVAALRDAVDTVLQRFDEG